MTSELEQIVRTHAGWLHASAQRQVRDPAMADDVTQAVFILLWQKQPSLSSEGQLVVWLHRTAGYCAANARRLQAVRARREKEAAMRREEYSEKQSDGVSEELDAAVSRLGARDRQAILLRFSREMEYSQVGELMGVSADAARVRVDRALQKLNRLLSARMGGVASQASVVALLGAKDAPGQWLEQTVTSIRDGYGSSGAAELLNHAESVKPAHIGMVSVALAAAVIMVALLGAEDQPAPAPQPPAVPARSVETVEAQVPPENLPMQPGFPLAVPGSIVAAPSVGDLDGDGKLEILVSCMQRTFDGRFAHSSPDSACQVFALQFDGTVHPGWPVVLRDRKEREEIRRRKEDTSQNWASSPSTADLDGDGKDEVVVVASDGDRTTFVIRGDGKILQRFPNGDPWVSAPVVDVNGDNTLDIVLGGVASSWNGEALPGWIDKPSGFGMCVGDANGDGTVELYLPTFSYLGEIQGFDEFGLMLDGWPKKVQYQCLFPPAMGDVDGDGNMEIIAADQGGHILAWKWNGTPLEGTQSNGNIDAVFKPIGASGASPCLADLDRDGIAEIIVFNGTLYAWRGNGQGVYQPDGVVARIETGQDVWRSHGCTVADLGDDGVMDFFAGGHWIKVTRDGKVDVTPLLPKGAKCVTQVTVCDLERDGLAELLYGSMDGQLFAYRTEMACADRLMEWPTSNRDFRHTGAWSKGGLKPREVRAGKPER